MTYGVGIDVSKHWLDIHVHGLGHSARLGNTPAGYGKLQAWLSPHALRLVLLEATGGYAGRDCAATDPTCLPQHPHAILAGCAAGAARAIMRA